MLALLVLAYCIATAICLVVLLIDFLFDLSMYGKYKGGWRRAILYILFAWALVTAAIVFTGFTLQLISMAGGLPTCTNAPITGKVTCQ